MKKDVVQIKNPKIGMYVRIHKTYGRMIGSKKEPYKNIPIIERGKE